MLKTQHAQLATQFSDARTEWANYWYDPRHIRGREAPLMDLRVDLPPGITLSKPVQQPEVPEGMEALRRDLASAVAARLGIPRSMIGAGAACG